MPTLPHPPDADRVLLVSAYEMGHVPLGLVGPAGALRRAGVPVRCVDLAVERLDDAALRRAELVAISTPMHTAMRLGARLARRVRRANPRAHVAFYGLYAGLNARHLGPLADSCLDAESEAMLVRLARAVIDRPPGTPPRRVRVPVASPLDDRRRSLARLARDAAGPDRDAVPPRAAHVHLLSPGRRVPAGATLASRGCRYRCRHCPIVPAYRGRFYALPVDRVIADVDAMVERGVGHVTFADPDFLNAPTHARRIVDALHRRHPDVTFDFTARVDHLLGHLDLVARFADRGCAFVVSAIESFDDRVLEALDKGHTRRDALALIRAMRRLALPLRPTFVPFTPWERPAGWLELFRVVEGEGLVDAVDPVQYALRLLVPDRSRLLELPSMRRVLGPWDRERFTWTWTHPDARMERAAQRAARLVERATVDARPAPETFARLARLAARTARRRPHPPAPAGPDRATGRERVPQSPPAPRDVPVRRRGHAGARAPRLSEPWFC